jgi:hypothetical protein
LLFSALLRHVLKREKKLFPGVVKKASSVAAELLHFTALHCVAQQELLLYCNVTS